MEDSLELSFSEFELTEKENLQAVNKGFKAEVELFKQFFDLQLNLFQNHVKGALDPYYGLQEYERIIIQAFLKTNSLLYSAFNLVIKGNFGSANVLLRQAFEFLILGKYVSAVKDEVMASRWLNNGQFDIYDKVIRLLATPNKKNLHDYWIIACQLAHASMVANQVIFKARDNFSKIHASLIMILIFQRCNYHLLSICLINKKLIYRSEFYGGFKIKNSNLKSEARGYKSKILNLLSPDGIKLVKDYECKWTFKK